MLRTARKGAVLLNKLKCENDCNQNEKEVHNMKAAVIHEFGDVDVFKHEDIGTPKPKPGHILIKVLAAGGRSFGSLYP